MAVLHTLFFLSHETFKVCFPCPEYAVSDFLPQNRPVLQADQSAQIAGICGKIALRRFFPAKQAQEQRGDADGPGLLQWLSSFAPSG